MYAMLPAYGTRWYVALLPPSNTFLLLALLFSISPLISYWKTLTLCS